MKSPTDPSSSSDRNLPASSNNPAINGTLMAGAGPVPPVITSAPAGSAGNSASFRNFVAVCLSLCLGLFLVAGTVSLLDDSLVLFWGQHLFTLASGILAFVTFFLLLLIYGLMGLTPIIPRRVFLPVIIFTGLGLMAVFPTLIYGYNQILHLDWLLSFLQVVIVLVICRRLQRGGRFRWSVVEVRHLGSRAFSWRNLSVFVLVNVFVLLPAVIVYFLLFTALAVDHFSGGFMALHSNGLSVQVRKYVRNDGKTIELFPMSHIADARFYQYVSQSFPTNSIILMEGVTDENNLLTNKITYKRMAKSLGLAEQHETFVPTRGEMVPADVDVDQFSQDTIDLLNLAMLVHAKGLTPGNVQKLMEYSPPTHFEKEFINDLVTKRNQHLVEEIQSKLSQTDNIMVPWGVAHMPGIADEIQKSGFRLDATHEYMVIQFRNKGSQSDGIKP